MARQPNVPHRCFCSRSQCRRTQRPSPNQPGQGGHPSPQLTSNGPGQIQFDGAISKTYVIERAYALGPLTNWTGISTQTLTSPKFIFTDPAASQTNAAYYRARWVK